MDKVQIDENLFCMAQHLRSFVEDSKHHRIADFGRPCATCEIRRNCDFDFYRKSDTLTELTGIRISPLKRKAKIKGLMVLLRKQGTCSQKSSRTP